MPKKKKLKPPRAGMGRDTRDERIELFCLEFVKDRNAARAARAAGYSERAAKETGCFLLTKPNIKKRISDLTAELMRTVKLEGEQAMLEIQQIGVFDPRRIFDRKGNVLPPDEWPDDVAHCIAGIEVRETYHPITHVKTGYVKKVKFKDGLRALEDLSKHLGVLKDSVDLNANHKVQSVNEAEVKAMREKIKSDI